MTQFKLQIKPLSEGVGLGSLVAANRGALSSVAPPKNPLDVQEGFEADEASQRRMAQAAYGPSSVASSIRQQPVVRFTTSFIRFCSGFGLDLFVVTFTAMVLTWSGVLAWNAGASGSLNIAEAVAVVRNVLLAVTPVFLLAVAIILTLCWRGIKLVIRL